MLRTGPQDGSRRKIGLELTNSAPVGAIHRGDVRADLPEGMADQAFAD